MDIASHGDAAILDELRLQFSADAYLRPSPADDALGANEVLLGVDVECVHRRLAYNGAPRPDFEAVANDAVDQDIAGKHDMSGGKVHGSFDDEDLVNVDPVAAHEEASVDGRYQQIAAPFDICSGDHAPDRLPREGNAPAEYIGAGLSGDAGHYPRDRFPGLDHMDAAHLAEVYALSVFRNRKARPPEFGFELGVLGNFLYRRRALRDHHGAHHVPFEIRAHQRVIDLIPEYTARRADPVQEGSEVVAAYRHSLAGRREEGRFDQHAVLRNLQLRVAVVLVHTAPGRRIEILGLPFRLSAPKRRPLRFFGFRAIIDGAFSLENR